MESSGYLRGAPSHPDVEDALDFERRKELATRRRREELREQLRRSGSVVEYAANPVTSNARSSPHKNRYNAATAALDAYQKAFTSVSTLNDKAAAQTRLPDGDPRAYLMRRQQLMAVNTERPSSAKLQRTKTMLLPLETIPDSAELHNLIHTVSIDIDLMSKALFRLTGLDEYVRCGNQTTGLNIPVVDLTRIEKRLENMVNRWSQETQGGQENIELQLAGLRGRSAGVA